MKLIMNIKEYMSAHGGETIYFQDGYCMQIYQNGKTLNISKKADGKLTMLCTIETRKDEHQIFISFQKEDTPYEIGYDGEFIALDQPLKALCDCQHSDGRKVYELLNNINL